MITNVIDTLEVACYIAIIYQKQVTGGQFLAVLTVLFEIEVRGLDRSLHREGVRIVARGKSIKGCGRFSVDQEGSVLGTNRESDSFWRRAGIGIFAEQNRCYTPMNIYATVKTREKDRTNHHV